MASTTGSTARRWRASALVLLLPLTACTDAAPAAPTPTASRSVTPTPTPTPTAEAPPAARLEAVAAGLDVPWSMAVVGDSVLVSERDSGRILEITATREVREVLTVPDVRFGGEGGLMGLAIDRSGKRLYVSSTAEAGNRVQSYGIEGAPGGLSLSGPADVITGLPSARNHNGGRLAVGPDGKLYVTVGDAGMPGAAQDLGSLAGKILRLESDGAVPTDNPFPGSPVYSWGHRNPQGIAWAPDGRMFASEFGQDTWDELNLITPGANYGWPVVEGVGGDPAYADPVQVWATDAASPSGLAAIGDTLYLTNLRGARLRAILVADPASSIEYLTGEFGRLRDVAQGPDGRIWVTTSNHDGRGEPQPDDDRVLSLDPAQLGG